MEVRLIPAGGLTMNQKFERSLELVWLSKDEYWSRIVELGQESVINKSTPTLDHSRRNIVFLALEKIEN